MHTGWLAYELLSELEYNLGGKGAKHLGWNRVMCA